MAERLVCNEFYTIWKKEVVA